MSANSSDKPRVVVLCGPTGVGKTGLSLDLAEAFGGNIVGADSMQVYRHMDIGTAKPAPEERKRVPHHMIDVADPDEDFSAGRYARMAREIIVELNQAGVLPVLVGGTGLYIKACLHGLFRKHSADTAILERLAGEAREQGVLALHERLKVCDPDTAGRVHPNDLFRIVRALEIFESTGLPASGHRQAHRFADDPFDALKICLHMERRALYERINRRVDAMMAAGFEDEVRGLLARGYGPDLKSMQSIGYRHISDFLAGTVPREKAVETMKQDTRRYAKRQETWFRADPDMVWVDKKEGLEKAVFLIEKFLRYRGDK
ncbi:MAG: tRNA (adenosine(37)-N6)-dimethylallyltransferase MiaA [Thermodesulfobacteriota bacterium]